MKLDFKVIEFVLRLSASFFALAFEEGKMITARKKESTATKRAPMRQSTINNVAAGTTLGDLDAFCQTESRVGKR